MKEDRRLDRPTKVDEERIKDIIADYQHIKFSGDDTQAKPVALESYSRIWTQ